MALLRSPFPDIPTRPMQVAPVAMQMTKPPVCKKPINIGFWLRVCGLVFILTVYGTAFALFLPSAATQAASFLNGEGPAPTAATYHCVHMTVIKTSTNTWTTSTDYAC